MNTAVQSSRTAFGRSAVRSAVRSSRSLRPVTVAAAKPNWLPGSQTPAYLDGLPASYGFDVLKLGEEAGALKWYVQAELIHCRWAMLGAAGILIPSALTSAGALNLPAWYDAGKVVQESSAIPFATLLVIQHIMLGFVEMKRLQDFIKPGSQAEPGSFLGLESGFAGKEVGYPGGLFDPMGFSRGSDESYKTYKVKEIKNGRLAMMAVLGFIAQYQATGKGPIENLADHLADPWNNNFTTNGVSLPFLN